MILLYYFHCIIVILSTLSSGMFFVSKVCIFWLVAVSYTVLLHLDVKYRNVIGRNGLKWHAIIIAVSFGIYVSGEHTIYVPREHSIYVPREHNI